MKVSLDHLHPCMVGREKCARLGVGKVEGGTVFIRSALVQRAISYLTSGTSVELTGPRFSGRTEALHRVQQALTGLGYAVLTVQGVGPSIAFEAIRLALPPGTRRPPNAPLSSVALSNAMVEFLAEGPSVVLVDDLEQLDEYSWTVVESVHKATQVPLLVSSLPPRRSRHSHRPLSRIAAPVLRLGLAPMTREELHDIFQARLDGPVAPTVSARLHTKSAGLPGLALNHLDSAMAHARIRKTGSMWVDDVDLWTPEMDGSYEALLADQGSKSKDAIEVLALTGAVPMDIAVGLVGQRCLERLEDDGFVEVVVTPDQSLIAITPPGLGSYFRNQPSSARRTRIVAEAARLVPLGSRGHARLDQLSPGAQPLDLQQPRDHQGPLVARLLTDAYSVELLEARRAWETNKTAKNASRYLWLQLSAPDDPEEIDRVVRETLTDGTGDATAEVEVRFFHARWLLHQDAPLHEALEPLRVPPGSAEPLSELMAVISYSLCVEFAGLDADYEAYLGPKMAYGGVVANLACLTLATCHALSGRGEEALEVLSSIPAPSSNVSRVHYTMCRGLALYAAGRFDEAILFAERESALAAGRLDRVALSGLAYISAASLASLGRFDEAQEAANLVLATSSQSIPLSFSPDRALLVVVAIAATRTGREISAASLIEQARHVGNRTLALPCATIEWAEGAASVSEGDRETAAAVFATIASELNALNFTLAANVATLAELLFDYRATDAAAFKDAAVAIGGELYSLYLDARRAMQSEDPSELLAIASRLHELGASGEALRFHTHAARLFRATGDSDAANRARSVARQIVESSGGRNENGFSHPDVGLTPREREIARLVAAGNANGEISQLLFVSTRTVETHLRNIRRKTGAVGRSEIGQFAEPESGR